MEENSHLQVLAVYGVICLIVAILAAISKPIYGAYTNGPVIHFNQIADLVMFTAFWYAVSVSLTLFNKWFYTFWEGGFDLPLSATACHMVVKAVLAQSLIASRCSPLKEEHIDLSWKETIVIVAPIGFATAGDIVLSNFSFLYITVTLYTILKSASLLWILFWGVLFLLEKCSMKLSLVCIAVSVGLGLASYSETHVSKVGIILVLLAGCLGGLRWALSQRLIYLHDRFRKSSLHLVAKIAPWSALSSVLVALLCDSHRIYHITQDGWQNKDTDDDTKISGTYMLTGALVFIVVGGIASFLLLLVEVKLLQLTSSLTLGVLGTIKEILQILLAVLVFNDKFTLWNGLGLLLCIIGTLGYQQLKSIENANSNEVHDYDPVRQADVELEFFLNTEDESDAELSDGWDDMS
mmetsp:Transcript_19016/g.24810  ORF Transcript_19016/g.24810 Transcript_19016/m.24810 type:complete len:408 (-) Transcript_19016:134-1357(-)